ncbi:hypothetical protein PRZ61_10645 [Halomonas pacifica]|uniref:Uncharacterized protein n=1 Tax=Bisbaumannia pacifica TaxID=77098 RepID=A0A510XCP4_9GAMM|nr:hypothetical protein [Halomonas pacifica]MDC8803893.1 hypothetical protein [Halomonas pacifica]GEK49212.1 hypothetical protein HPA02_34950 [Halomonas pacifica]
MSNAAENLAPQPYAAELIELNNVEKQLGELRAKYGTVPDYATKEGYAAGKKAIQALTKMRTGTDKARLAITQPHRDFVAQVNERAKGLIAEVEKLEKPHRNAKQAVDEAEERKRQERIASLREKLSKEVTSYLDTAAGLGSTALADLIDAAEGIDTEGYYDITSEAEDEKARVLRQLRDMHAQALQREQLAAQQEEIERQKAEMARMQAAMAPAAPAEPAEPTVPAEPAKPREVVTAGGTVFGFDDESPWDEALADLIGLGIDVSAAECVLEAISNGDVRHVTLNATTGE